MISALRQAFGQWLISLVVKHVWPSESVLDVAVKQELLRAMQLGLRLRPAESLEHHPLVVAALKGGKAHDR